jgi:hypothetical protein
MATLSPLLTIAAAAAEVVEVAAEADSDEKLKMARNGPWLQPPHSLPHHPPRSSGYGIESHPFLLFLL